MKTGCVYGYPLLLFWTLSVLVLGYKRRSGKLDLGQNIGFEEAFQTSKNQYDWIMTIYFDVTPSCSSSGLGGVPGVKAAG